MTKNTLPISFPLDNIEALQNWAFRIFFRFPRWIKPAFLKGCYAMLSSVSSSFINSRSLFHLRYLVTIQFLLYKKAQLSSSKEIYLRIFTIGTRLCVILCYPKGEKVLREASILEVVNQILSSLKPIQDSFYQWTQENISYHFCYIELQKIRGNRLKIPEIRSIEKVLKKKLHTYTLQGSVFSPYNYEDAFKQLLAMGKKITHPLDKPQIAIYTQKKNNVDIEFLVYLARSKRIYSKRHVLESSFPKSIRLVSHLLQEISGNIPIILEAFSLFVPIRRITRKIAINLLDTRDFVANVLEDVVGPFSDYNSGLFDKNKKKFKELSLLFSEKIPHFSLFAEPLFYSLLPFESQLKLETSILQKLFMEVSLALTRSTPFPTRFNPYVCVLKFPHTDELGLHLNFTKTLLKENKISAYASFDILSTHYLCLVDRTGHQLREMEIARNFASLDHRKERILHLGFHLDTPPPLSHHYLAKDLRGRTISGFLFEGLLRMGPTGRLEYANCKQVTISNKKTRYLFEIRDTHWSNGIKVTAPQYEKSWKYSFSHSLGRHFFYNIKNALLIQKNEQPMESLGIQALDESHLQVDLEHEDPSFLHKLTAPCFFPYLETDLETDAEHKVFNGPYCIEKQEIQKLFLEKNYYYWDAKNIFFNKVKISFGNTLKKNEQLFRQGEIDWIGTPFDFDTNLSIFKKKKTIRFPFLLHFNTTTLALSSPLIRRALSLVIDRQWIAKTIFQTIPIGSLLSFSPLKEPVDPLLREKARELFQKGLKNLGVKKENIPPIRISSLELNTHCQLSHYLRKQWKEVFGIEVDFAYTKCNDFYQSLELGTFDVAGCFIDIFPADPLPFLRTFSRKQFNYSRWSLPEYSKVISELMQEGNKRKKRALLQRAEDLLIEHRPVAPLITFRHHYECHPKLEGYVLQDNGAIDFRFASCSTP